MQMLTIALAGSASAVLVCLLASHIAFGRSHWPTSSFGASPWQPTSLNPRGLVREEELRGESVPDEEELALRARLPNGVFDLFLLLERGVFEKITSMPRLVDDDKALLLDRAQFTTELKVHVEEMLLLLKLGIQLLGVLLSILVPLTITAYALLNQPFHIPTPPIFLRVADLLSFALMPLDRLFSPLLRLVVRVTGLAGELDPLLDGDDGCELINKAKRILLGLLVLNVIVSLVTFLVLALFVGIVRCSGILRW
jgi:hypothetical protein